MTNDSPTASNDATGSVAAVDDVTAAADKLAHARDDLFIFITKRTEFAGITTTHRIKIALESEDKEYAVWEATHDENPDTWMVICQPYGRAPSVVSHAQDPILELFLFFAFANDYLREKEATR